MLLEAPFDKSRANKNSVLLTIDLTTAVADEAIKNRNSVVVAYRKSPHSQQTRHDLAVDATPNLVNSTQKTNTPLTHHLQTQSSSVASNPSPSPTPSNAPSSA